MDLASKRICLVSHDAGGSEILAAFFQKFYTLQFQAFLEGPAVKIFENRLRTRSKFKNFEDFQRNFLKENYDLLLTSVSWGSQSERRAWILAEKLGIPSIAYIEGWGDYMAPLFIQNGEDVSPGRIWATDEATENCLKKIGIKCPIERHPNYFLLNIKDRILKLSDEHPHDTADSRRILYLCENISSCEAKLGEKRGELGRGYDEIDALRYFLSQLNSPQNLRIRIRPHPSENPEKYWPVIQSFSQLHIEFSKTTNSLEQDIAWANSVAGCESIALYIGAMSGREAISYIPPTARIGCRLPYSEVKAYSPPSK